MTVMLALFTRAVRCARSAFGFRSMISKLTEDGILVQSMLACIPSELRAQAPGLGRFYGGGAVQAGAEA